MMHEDEARFLAKVQMPAEGCWEWQASTDGSGYGQFVYGGRTVRAHRFSYLLEHGSIPAGALILHRCDNPLCVRPSHLYAGDKRRNALDAQERGQGIKGEATIGARLTALQVIAARREYREEGMTYRALARKYGVSLSTIYRAVTERTWNHL